MFNYCIGNGHISHGSPSKVIEAYNSVFCYDLFAISESLLNKSIEDDEIYIEGFSKEIFRSDHPSGNKVGVYAFILKKTFQLNVVRTWRFSKKL